jgi:hypothetical protein
VKLSLRFAVLPIAAALSANAAHAGPMEAAQSAASAASGVAARTEGAVKRGAKATNDAIERGAKATGAAVTKAAKKVGLPTGPASAPAHTQWQLSQRPAVRATSRCRHTCSRARPGDPQCFGRWL